MQPREPYSTHTHTHTHTHSVHMIYIHTQVRAAPRAVLTDGGHVGEQRYAAAGDASRLQCERALPRLLAACAQRRRGGLGAGARAEGSLTGAARVAAHALPNDAVVQLYMYMYMYMYTYSCTRLWKRALQSVLVGDTTRSHRDSRVVAVPNFVCCIIIII